MYPEDQSSLLPKQGKLAPTCSGAKRSFHISGSNPVRTQDPGPRAGPTPGAAVEGYRAEEACSRRLTSSATGKSAS